MATLMGAVTFTACNNDDEPVINNDKVAVQFAAGIGGNVATGTPETRAAGTSWAALDEIGIFMVDAGALTISESAENMKYVTSSAGSSNTFLADGTTNTIYYPSTGSVNFIAYYPWETGAVLGTPINVEIATAQTAANQPDFDLLYVKGTTAYTNSSVGAVPLAFDHKLAKLVMNLEAGGGASLTNVSISIKGMFTKNTFSLGTGSFGATATTPVAITPREITANASYDAIILPQYYASGVVTVEFTAGGDTYTWNVGAMTFAPGNEYVYTVTLSKGGGVTVTGSINPWTSTNMGGVTAEN